MTRLARPTIPRDGWVCSEPEHEGSVYVLTVGGN